MLLSSRRREVPKHACVVQLAVGEKHALLLTDQGVVYSWGSSNSQGQLGRITHTPDKERDPFPIADLLKNEVIVQIACGSNHCLALSREGVLFAWGFNKAGQLGLGLKPGDTQNNAAIIQKLPAMVAPFTKEGKRPVRSCSCGPKSSACVTLKGEVYVWGAISYYLFLGGTTYDRNIGENCTVPVQIRHHVDPKKPLGDFVPDQIALYQDKFACTLARENIYDDLLSTLAILKERSSQLSILSRAKKNELEKGGNIENYTPESFGEVNELILDIRKQRDELEKRLRTIEDDRVKCLANLHYVSRQLTATDQREAMLAEYADQLEFNLERRSPLEKEVRLRTIEDERSDSHLDLLRAGSKGIAADQQRVALMVGKSGIKEAQTKGLKTELSDVQYFRSSHAKARLEYLNQFDGCQQRLSVLDQEYTTLTQQKKDIDGRLRLVKQLKNGIHTNDMHQAVDEGFVIAMNKRDEIAATDLTSLCAVNGRFTGFREVLSISDHAIRDVFNALKEISSVAGSQGLLIEEALEANLKLRKELNALVQEKLGRAEYGRKPLEKYPGLLQFFNEARFTQLDAEV